MTLSNIISISRIVLAPIVALLIFQEMWLGALVLLLAAFATDILDGYVARKLKQVSDTGKVLDYVADKTLLFLVVGALLWVFGNAALNWAYLLMFFAKDIINLTGIIILRSIKQISSRKLGKAVMALQAITLFWIILQFPHFEFLIYIVFVLGVISGIDYIANFKGKLKKRC